MSDLADIKKSMEKIEKTVIKIDKDFSYHKGRHSATDGQTKLFGTLGGILGGFLAGFFGFGKH